MNICHFCKKEFLGKIQPGTKAIYCSPKCRGRMGYSKRKQKSIPYVPPKNIKNICQKCSVVFMDSRVAKYCSKECYLERNFRITENNLIEKRCSKCKKYKPRDIDHFCLAVANTRDGLNSRCKVCVSKYQKTSAARILRKASRIRRVDKIKQQTKEYRSRPGFKEKKNAAESARKKIDPSFALKNRIRILMYATLRKVKNGRKWQTLVGYSIDDLRRHIEKQFKDGMSWERFMAGEIHIDHIIPVSAFNYTKPEDFDFKRCWALKNLQPKWAKENLSKGAKIGKPFQPSLLIERS